MKASFNKANILAISTCLPNVVESIDMRIDDFYNGNVKQLERIKKSTGLNKKYVSDNLTTALDLCYASSLEIFNFFPRDKIDCVIFVTQTPDFLIPNNSHILHGKLGLKEQCICFDINQGCSGYVYGLFLAYSLIENGSCNNILLCAGDTISTVVDSNDSNTAPLFGDGGSATIISNEKYSSSFFYIGSDGKGWENLVLPNSGFRLNPYFEKADSGSKTLFMDGAEVFNFSIMRETIAINNILEYAKITVDELDFLFFHQANAYIISNIARRVGIPLNKVPISSISQYGNTSSASIPLAVCDARLDLKEHNKIVLSGFGVGLSWATCCLELNDARIFTPIILKENYDKK